MRIGYCITAVGLLALAACGSSDDGDGGSAASGGAVTLQPGEWEMKMEIGRASMRPACRRRSPPR